MISNSFNRFIFHVSELTNQQDISYVVIGRDGGQESEVGF